MNWRTEEWLDISICLHVEKSNELAYRFYERLGYRVFDDQGERYLIVKDL